MGQYTLSSKWSAVVAIDQHARSLALAGIDLRTGEVRQGRLTGCPGAADVSGWALGWAEGPVRFAYESGPCGFQLARDLRAAGHDCDVIAVSSIPRSAADRRFKDDRRDARSLLEALVSPSGRCRAVHVPSPDAEAARDLVRAYHDAVASATRLKLQTSAMLLRHGRVWDERTPSGRLRATWTRDYLAWARAARLGDPDEDATLKFYITAAVDMSERARALRARCAEVACRGRFAPYVDALCRLKGVDSLFALTYASYVDDFSRFRNGRSVSSYFGLTPGRHDSGEHVGRGGGISKAGDTTVRRSAIEGLASISGHSGPAKAAPAEGHAVSAAVEAEALKCNARNQKRYADLVGRGKRPVVARVAVASELVSQMWVLGRMVDHERAGA